MSTFSILPILDYLHSPSFFNWIVTVATNEFKYHLTSLVAILLQQLLSHHLLPSVITAATNSVVIASAAESILVLTWPVCCLLRYTMHVCSQYFTQPIAVSSSLVRQHKLATPGFTRMRCSRSVSTTLTKPHIVGVGTAFSFVNLPPFVLHLHTASNHSKCHLSLLNSSVPTLLSPMSIVLLQLPQKLANL